jgi:hypothetical protein
MGKIIDIAKVRDILSKRSLESDERRYYADLPPLRPGFLKVDSQILLANIIFQIKEVRGFDKVSLIDRSNFIDTEILFQTIKYHTIDSIRGTESLDKKLKHDFVFASFPYGLKDIPEWSIPMPNMDTSTNLIVNSVDVISENGLGLFFSLSPYRINRDKIREHLFKKGYFINAIICLPSTFHSPITGLPAYLIIISKNKTEKEFVLNINSFKYSVFDFRKNMFNDKKNDSIFIDHNFNDIDKGIWLTSGKFDTIDGYKLRRELDSLGGDFASFEDIPLSKLCAEINLIPGNGSKIFKDKEDNIYLPLIGNKPPCLTIDGMEIKQHNYAQLIVNTSKVSIEYLVNFLKSDLGKKILAIEKSHKGIIPRLSKSDILNISIRLPSLDIQKNIIDIIRKFELMKTKINDLGESIMKNPISNDKSIEQINSINESLNLLTNSDKIKNIISLGESKTSEFKQTVTYCIREKTRQKYITDSWVKNIGAFLNSQGGDLLLGVSDDQKITGMKFEMEKFFKQGGNDLGDNLMKHVKNIIKEKIGEEFYPLIDAELVPIDDDYVLWIKCTASDREVFVNKNDFYVRTHPATDKLEGKKLLDYIEIRFRNRSI